MFNKRVATLLKLKTKIKLELVNIKFLIKIVKVEIFI